MRATILADADKAGEVELLSAWLAKWQQTLSICSEELGCGCCVFIRDVDAPAHALAEIPAEMLADSAWARGAS